MPSCEKCWSDAALNSALSGEDPATNYAELVASRTRRGASCTPEEQAGPLAKTCPSCARRTIHQHAHVCMNPSCSPLGGLLDAREAQTVKQ